MLKRCTAFFLLLVFVAVTFSRAVILLDFYVNRDFITRNLCENRDKPMMHCCGRCQLRKRLAQENNADKNNPERKPDNKNEELFLREPRTLLFIAVMSYRKLLYPAPASATPVDRPSSIFRPPDC